MAIREALARVVKQVLSPVDNRGGGWFSLWGTIEEAFSGAWQRNIKEHRASVLHYSPVFSCITLIASDMSKMEWCIRQWNEKNQIWEKAKRSKASQYLKVLRKPNNYQNQNQFRECWMISKLTHGNTYGLIVRDLRGMIQQVFILDPTRVTPLVTDDGQVFYQLSPDNMTGGLLKNGVVVPASEIIHDRFNCMFHPLVGISPIFACALPAMVGIKAQDNYYTFFKNGARPSGILTAPGSLTKETAATLKKQFDEGFTGKNAGKTAVLADGLKYERVTMSAVDSQMVAQLQMGTEMICATFHVPQYKINAGPAPSAENIESLQQDYISTTLQKHIEDMEAVWNESLGLDENVWAHLDTDNLLRLDQSTLMSTMKEGTGAAILSANEARRRFNLAPVKGGDSPLAQQQNYSLEALAKRDAKDDPFATGSSTPPANPPAAPTAEEPTDEDANQSEQLSAEFLTKAFQALELEFA
jgi:HK97 family phage portal protein